MVNPAATLLLIIASLMAQTPPVSAPNSATEQDIRVHVQKSGALIRVDVEMTVPASAQEVWDVLTDYEHMAQFVSNVRSSEVLNRDTDRLEVAQKSATTFGLLHFAFDNVRRIELTPPREIHSQVTSGDMNGSAFTTRISGDGATTRVVNHGDFVPTLWIPPVIGPAFMEAQTRKQFAELRAEILRRKAAGTRDGKR